MSLNFSKRVFTSIILLIILLIGLFTNKYIWICLLIAVSIISFIEFNNLINKTSNKAIYQSYIYKIISFLYLIFFVYVGYNLYILSITFVLFILLVCILSDTGGYVIGKLIGGKKLTHISPNKTISGSVGSFIFSLFSIIILLFFNDLNSQPVNLIQLIFITLFFSLTCQLGDLFISYFKRLANVKDTGSILPGHGGLLDRIDGVIFVLPVAYIIEKIFT